MAFITNALAIATVIHVVCMAWTISLGPGQIIPSWAICFHVPAMVLMAFAHSVHHIGLKQAAGFFGTIVVVEWVWEQLNVSYDGFIFGNLSYHDSLIGPKVGDIPFIVPFAFAALCWPAYVMVNLILHGHPIKTSGAEDSLLALVWRCAIFSFVHSAWSLSVEPLIFKFGAFGYPKLGAPGGTWIPGTWFGVPYTEFRGWWLMAFFGVFVYSRFVAPFLTMPPQKPLCRIVDSSPLVLFGGFAVWLVVNNIDQVVGAFALWTMGVSLLQAAYKIAFAEECGHDEVVLVDYHSDAAFTASGASSRAVSPAASREPSPAASREASPEPVVLARGRTPAKASAKKTSKATKTPKKTPKKTSTKTPKTPKANRSGKKGQ